MPKIGYDISNIEKVFSRMILSDSFPSSDMITDLRNEINEFFSEAKCVDVIYTNNLDKLFFGVVTMPIINYEDTIKVIMDSEEMKIKEYYIELDSKLFSAELTAKELTAYLISQIHSLVCESVISRVRDAIDVYFSEQDKIINLKSSTQYTQLLTLGIKDTIIKFTSNIYKTDDQFYSDVFLSQTGYTVSMLESIGKLSGAPVGFSSISRQPKLSILEWIFNLYDDVKTKRIPALDTLNEAKQFAGSILIKKEIDNAILALNRIDTDVTLEGAVLEASTKKKGLVSQIRANGLRGIENDLYEFKIRIKNLQTEEEAMYTLRQINARLTLLEDSLSDIEMDDREYDKWYKVLEQYNALREELSSKSIWNRKKYGIWYDYNAME